MSTESQSVKEDISSEADEQSQNSSEKEGEEMVEVEKVKLDELEQEADEFREKYYRRTADLDNLRKRFRREEKKFKKYANADLLEDLLEVMDNFERALDSIEFDNDEVSRGVEMIYEQLSDLLDRYKVEPIEAAGEVFDPEKHDGMMREERDDLDQQTVLEVFQKGYKLYDRILRPASVKVGVPAETGEEADEDNEDDE